MPQIPPRSRYSGNSVSQKNSQLGSACLLKRSALEELGLGFPQIMNTQWVVVPICNLHGRTKVVDEKGEMRTIFFYTSNRLEFVWRYSECRHPTEQHLRNG